MLHDIIPTSFVYVFHTEIHTLQKCFSRKHQPSWIKNIIVQEIFYIFRTIVQFIYNMSLRNITNRSFIEINQVEKKHWILIIPSILFVHNILYSRIEHYWLYLTFYTNVCYVYVCNLFDFYDEGLRLYLTV